ncbi:LysR family transcriptional regulator [Brotaphodocola sp.]|uniref:LysR family transcriptional regulator n=1 Tax=Brotaphodocola sp. TaxID=3073577 RepID=UPI003D7CF668
MDFKQFQYVLKVAECRNITKAAEQLFVSQPALSSFLAKTEEELGAKIFDRSTNPLSLTQAGECYVKTAKRILALQENLKKDVEDLNTCRGGVIKIGLSDMRATVLLPFVLPEFKRLYPNIKIQTLESRSVGVEENVRSGAADLGLIPLYYMSDEFSTQVLYDEELLLVSGQELPCHRGELRSWVEIEELNDKDFIFLPSHTRIRRAIEAVFLEHGVRPRSIMDSSNHMTLYLIASTGMAMTIVPEAIVRMMNPVRLPHVYSLGKAGFHWNIGAIWRKDMELSSAQQLLVRLLKNHY